LKLYIDKSQCNHYIKVVVDPKILDDNDSLASFLFFKRKKKNGHFGIMYLPRKNIDSPTVVHELVHAALFWVMRYSDYKKVYKMSEEEQYLYYHEATACAVDNMYEQYLKERNQWLLRK
jgi:hypothetical protein